MTQLYVRLSPTVRYLVPDCYTGSVVTNPADDKCKLCPVRGECASRQMAEVVGVGVESGT